VSISADFDDSAGIDGNRGASETAFVAIAIDTLAYARRLREAGFTEQQAEGQAEALAAAMTDTLATKQDLRDLESRIEARFTQIEVRFTQIDARFDEMERNVGHRLGEQTAILRGEMADLERRMTMRLGGITIASVGLFSALAKVL
jgi:hypothetical protein